MSLQTDLAEHLEGAKAAIERASFDMDNDRRNNVEPDLLLGIAHALTGILQVLAQGHINVDDGKA